MVHPVTPDTLPITGTGGGNNWTWSIRPTQPGSYTLILSVVALDAEGKPFYQNVTEDVNVQADLTFAYAMGAVGRFFTSVAAILSAGAAALVALAGVFTVRRRRRRTRTAPAPAEHEPKSGYL